MSLFRTLTQTAPVAGMEGQTIDIAPVSDEPVASLEMVAVDFLNLEDEIAAFEALDTQLSNLQHLELVASAPGVESLVDFLTTADLLGSTALMMNTDTAALEGIGDAIKNTLAKWSASAMESVKSIGSKISAFAASAWQSISGAASKLKTGVYNKTAAAKAHIKAHSKEYTIAAIGAIGVAATVAVGVWGIPYAKENQWAAKAQDLVSKFKFGKGKIKVNADGSIDVPFEEIIEPMKAGDLPALGYTDTSCKELSTHVTSELGKSSKLAGLGKAILDAAMKALNAVKGAPAAAAGLARKAFWSSLKACMKMVRLIMKLFSKVVKPAVSGAEKAYTGSGALVPA